MLGSFLKKYRLANGLTQADLAIKLSVSQNSISQYESGKRNPSVKRLADIAKVLNCSMNDIVSESDTHEQKGEDHGANRGICGGGSGDAGHVP